MRQTYDKWRLTMTFLLVLSLRQKVSTSTYLKKNYSDSIIVDHTIVKDDIKLCFAISHM